MSSPGRGRAPRAWLRLAGVVVALLAVSAAALVFVSQFGPLAGHPPPPASGCDGIEGARLGWVVYVRRGSLHVLDLATCRDRVLLSHGGAVPVKWSPDGRWIAFADARVVSSAGGRITRPLGLGVSRWSWEWSPRGDVLAGITGRDGVVVGGPGRPAEHLLPGRFGATGLAFDPSGDRIAVDGAGQRVWVVDVESGSRRQVYRTPGRKVASPIVAGWSPDGRWVLFWSDTLNSASLQADGLPLLAAPATGGRAVGVTDSMLVFRDFLAACGSRLVVSDGSDRYVNQGKVLVSVVPGPWSVTDLSRDRSRSWIWPACSPNGRWIAATAAPNRPIPRFGVDRRSIWLIASDGSTRRRVTDAPRVADELPRWSADGRYVVFVRRALRWCAPGRLFVAHVDPASGLPLSVAGPLAALGPGCGYYGHSVWGLETDWFRPPA